MKRIFIICNILLFVLSLNAEKAITFPELLNPKYLIINKNQLIISDYPHIYLYSLDDYSLIRKIGRRGVGPGEFYIMLENMNLKERGLFVSVCPYHIAANCMNRILYFSRKGDFIREERSHFGINAKFISLGDKLLGFLPDVMKGKLSVSLFDSNLIKQKEIFNCDYWWNFSSSESHNFFNRASDTLLVSVYDNKIFLARGDAPVFAIDVYDTNGYKLYTIIKHNPEKIKITQSFKDEIHKHFRIKFKEVSDYAIKTLNLPKYFPAIRNFGVADKKIYVFTFKRVSYNNEVLILDIKGNLLKKVLLPVQEMNPEYLSPFSFYKNKFYQLHFIEETANWELHITDIK